MAHIKNLFDRNFLEYASYVIKDRAIPDLEDGLKPVQRRILHSLFEMDDGKFHKVANVVGHCMKYHPHGDASIGDALVVLANKELFIEKQGNFGNIFTGDQASAARYIECRVTPLAKTIFYNPKLTLMTDSYDSRNKEPIRFPAKIPVILAIGAEGIAVGMSTRILPHNIIEVIQAEKDCLEGKPFRLYPDFPTGGLVDVSDYRDGSGKVLVRARLDTSDAKRIVIRELPFGSSTESLINSVESAAKAGHLKIQSINDFTTDHVEIEVKLARGVYAEETVNALFAFTECEQAISVNLLLIKDGLPEVMTVTQVIEHHTKQLVELLTKELELEKKELQEKMYLRVLERIFIEKQLYHEIEKMKTTEAVQKAVIAGFAPYTKEIGEGGLSREHVEHLLRIPIRRLSLFDISKAKAETREITVRIKAINVHLKHITDYAAAYLDQLITIIKSNAELGRGVRRSTVVAFEKVAVKKVVRRDVCLKYDRNTGYLGTAVNGEPAVDLSPFDRVLVLRNNGVYTVTGIPEKTFIGGGAWWIGIADKERVSRLVFTMIYKESVTGYPYIKRCVIEGWIMNREYPLAPPDAVILHIDTRQKFSFTLHYTPKPRMRIAKETFEAQAFPVKGLKVSGIRLTAREPERITLS
jgi:topoisomerase-4 subunit A